MKIRKILKLLGVGGLLFLGTLGFTWVFDSPLSTVLSFLWGGALGWLLAKVLLHE